MKKIFLIIAPILALAMVSCNKDNALTGRPDVVAVQEHEGETEIAFATAVNEARTRATEVTTGNLSTVYVTALKGSGTQTAAWSNVTFTKGTGSDTKFKEHTNGGKWWPNTDESYKFYVSNVALPTSGTTITVSPGDGSTDVVVGKAESVSFKTADIPVTLNHIFAQIGTIGVTVNSNLSAYSISNLNISFPAKTSGTYNIASDSWTTKGSGSNMPLVSGASIAAGGTFSTIANTEHRLVVPMEGSGNTDSDKYQFTASFTITRGDYTKSVNRTAWVKLEQGKRNNIAADLTIGSDGAVEIQFTVTVTDWVNTTQNVSF